MLASAEMGVVGVGAQRSGVFAQKESGARCFPASQKCKFSRKSNSQAPPEMLACKSQCISFPRNLDPASGNIRITVINTTTMATESQESLCMLKFF